MQVKVSFLQIITAEAPVKLDIPSNNRIFVDGKAHEVEYVNDIAVIERNGLPHKYVVGIFCLKLPLPLKSES